MKEQRENTEKFLKKLGYSDKAIKVIKPMPFEEADQGKANYSGDMDNCQICAPTLLARMRGINISADAYQNGGFMEALSHDMRLAFEGSEKLVTTKFTADKKPVKKMVEKLERTFENLPNNSIHHFGYDYNIDGEDGHIWTVIKANNKLFIVDGQEKRGTNYRLDDILPRIDFSKKVEMLRVDNVSFSDGFMNYYANTRKQKR